MLAPILPNMVRQGGGRIVDHAGQESAETDVLLYCPALLAPSFYSFGQERGLFPIDGCLYSIEIKSRLTATELKSAIANARVLRTLAYGHRQKTAASSPESIPVQSCLFAFDTDLTHDGKGELARYFECDPAHYNDAALSAFCVVGRGLFFGGRTEHGAWWQQSPANESFDKVIDFLSVLTNGVHAVISSREWPMVGQYLIDPREFERHYNDGRFHRFNSDGTMKPDTQRE